MRTSQHLRRLTKVDRTLQFTLIGCDRCVILIVLNVGAEVLSCRTPFVIFVPRDANGLLAEGLSCSVHGSTQEVGVTTTRYIMKIFALQAVLDSESIGVFIHVCSTI